MFCNGSTNWSKIISDKRGSSLQPEGCAAENPLFEWAVSLGHVRNKVDFVPLASEDVAWAQGYKTFFMLNSTEHEIFPAHKC